MKLNEILHVCTNLCIKNENEMTNYNKFDIWKRWLQEAQQIDQNRSYRGTYWLILDLMSECLVSFNSSQICPKEVLLHFNVCPMKSTHDVAYVPSILRLNWKRRQIITFHWENFNFLRGCSFWEALIQWPWNFLKWHVSKMTTISPVISLLVPYVKYENNSKRKCRIWLMTNCQSLWYRVF